MSEGRGWPRTPTEQRQARAMVAARIVAEGLSRAEARARNTGAGWMLVAPDGAAVAWRWGRNELTIIAAMIERETGRGWGD